MSNLTEITYEDGDIVWVRLSSFWWPGEVCGPAKLPNGLLETMKKRPLAVVRFFQEDTFEYVKNIDSICMYNCSKKFQFIKKGMDAFRAKKKIAEKFPEDVVTAEKLTHGNADILEDPEFQPKQKQSWNELFTDPKKKKPTTPKVSAVGKQRKSDHEVRMMEQNTPQASNSANSYKCTACNFSTNRLNVLILHNKNHTKVELATPKAAAPFSISPKKNATPKTSTKSLREVKQTPIIDYSGDEDEEFETPSKSRKKKPRKVTAKVVKSVTPKKPEKDEMPSSITVTPPNTNLEIKSTLLADWSDDEAAADIPQSNENVNAVPVVAAAPVPKADSPVKCRNIPKKRDDLRDFDALKSEPKLNDEPPRLEKEVEEEPLEKLLDEVGGEGNRSDTPRSTRRNRRTDLPPRSTRKTKRDEEQEKSQVETADLQAELEQVELEGKRNRRTETQSRSTRQTKKDVPEIESAMANVENVELEPETPEIIEKQNTRGNIQTSRTTRKTNKKMEEKIQDMDVETADAHVQLEPEPVIESRTTKRGTKKQQKIDLIKDEEETPRTRRSSRKDPMPKEETKIEIEQNESQDKVENEQIKTNEPITNTENEISTQLNEKAENENIPVSPKQESTEAINQTKLSNKTEEETQVMEVAEVKKTPKTIKEKGRKTPKLELETSVENLENKQVESQTESNESKGEDSTEEKPALRVSKRNRKTTEKVVENIEAQEEMKLMRKKKSESKSQRKSEDGVKSPTPKKIKAQDKPDEMLQTEIDALLSETSVPAICEELVVKTDIKLTPKERGKRQFKSKQAMPDHKTESELQIAEALTQLPETAIQFSPKKSPVKVTETEAPQPPVTMRNSNQSPKKRHLEIVAQSSSNESIKKQKIEPKILPKKRKSEYTNEFEDFLHKRRPDEDVVDEKTVRARIEKKEKDVVTRVKTDDDLFDIEKMEILFTNEPIESPASATQRRISHMSPSSSTTTTTKKVATKSSPMYELPPKVISRPSSVGSSPIKVNEFRRLSSPTQRTIESLRQETIGTHRKTLKVITEADGRKTLVEEVFRASAKGVPRASSSSPLARQEMTPIKQNIVANAQIVQKGQIIQTVGGSSNNIVITSKGALMTTTSQSSTTVQAPSKVSPSKIKSPNRIQVQSQEIILPVTSTTITTPKPIEHKAIVRKKELIAQHQKSQISPLSRPIEKPKTKKEVIKMSPAQLREAERLGYVEVRGGGKMLTKAGLREFLPTIRKEPQQKPPPVDIEQPTTSDESPSSCFKTSRRKTNSASSVIVIDDDVPPPPPPPVTERMEVESGMGQEPEIITKPSMQQHHQQQQKEEPIISAAATKDLQDQGQILAVPADSFGGPPNAFYLCTAGEDGNLTPINNEALYLDASNQLVPVAPPSDEKEDAVVANDGLSETVPNQSIILNTGDGNQIILDQQALVALASQGEMPQIITQDGQQLILPGTAQDILAALANQDIDQPLLIQTQDQDILATALASTEVFHSGDPSDVVLGPSIKAQVSETNAILTQPPIMSTSEQPTTNKNNGDIKPVVASEPKNLEDTLAEIGVVTPHTTVPVSLELPITVTNPAIAPRITNPLDVTQVYPPVVSVPSLIVPSCSALDITPTLAIPDILTDESYNAPHPDEGTPEANHASDTSSSEIPLPPPTNVNSSSAANNSEVINNNEIEKEIAASDEVPPEGSSDEQIDESR